MSQLRCYLHAQREAVCRCPRCQHFYCRECVTEHDGQYVCSACMRVLAATKKEAQSRWRAARWLLTPVLCALSFAVAWVYFYGLGQMLLAAFPTPIVGH